MKKLFLRIGFLGILISIAAPALADVTVNPSGTGDWPTIQDAVDHVSNGETIWLEEGTFNGIGNRDIDFQGKAITLRSVSTEPMQSGIDCENAGRAFYFHSGETSQTVISNILIINGYALNGGGIYCDGASPTLQGIAFSNCTAENNGGAGYFRNGSPAILTVSAYDNYAYVSGISTVNAGGGFYLENVNMTISQGDFYENIAGGSGSIGSGGCIYAVNSTLVLDGLFINRSIISGGGNGGSIYLSGCSDVRIENCNLYGSSLGSVVSGGNIYSADTNLSLINNFIGYGSAVNGGALYASGMGSITSIYCTLRSNTASAQGGAFYLDALTVANCVNSIFWENTALSGHEFYVNSGSTLVINYSDVQGGQAEIAGAGFINWQSGMLNILPQFAGEDYLSDLSPCIDAGIDDPVTWPLMPSCDREGNLRPQLKNVDIGSMEYRPEFTCSTSLDNMSTAGAADNFDSGACGFSGPDVSHQVRMTFVPCEMTATLSDEQGADFQVSFLNGTDPVTQCLSSGTTEATFIWNGSDPIMLVVDGGTGTFDLNLSCCAPANRITIGTTSYCTIQEAIDAALPGDTLLLADGTYSGDGNTDLQIMNKEITIRSSSGNPSACIIDGEDRNGGFNIFGPATSALEISDITLQNTHKSGNDGGCFYISSASPTIRNCIMSGCSMDAHKDAVNGVCIHSANGSPLITDCQFLGNSSFDSTSGILSMINSSAEIRNCIFKDNATSGPCAVFSNISTSRFINCAFLNNETNYEGGAVYAAGGGTLGLYNCTFRNNLTNNISGNGNALFLDGTDGTQMELVNCILWDNEAATSYQAALINNAILTISYSDVESGQSAVYVETGSTLTWGTGMASLEPGFDILDPFRFHLAAGSNCIDIGTGDTVSWPYLPIDDIDGESRPDGSGWDMGADEAVVTIPTPSPSPEATVTPVPVPVPSTGKAGVCIMLLFVGLILTIGVNKSHLLPDGKD